MPRLTETLSTEGHGPGDFEDNASDTEHKPGGAGTTGLHGHVKRDPPAALSLAPSPMCSI